jgi:hypothetical protein
MDFGVLFFQGKKHLLFSINREKYLNNVNDEYMKHKLLLPVITEKNNLVS